MSRRQFKSKRTFPPHSVLFAKMFPWGLPENDIDEPVPGTITERSVMKLGRRKRGGDSSTDNNNWLQCDLCNKWRLVSPDLFDRMSKATEFRCNLLTGTTCDDADDWEHVTKSTTDSPLQPRVAADETTIKAVKRRKPRARKRIVKPNIFSGSYIPGFAAPLSP